MTRRLARIRWTVAIIAAALVATIAAGSVLAHGPVAVSLTRPLPNPIRERQLVDVDGRVAGAPAGARAALELRPSHRWRIERSAPIGRRGRFAIRWRVNLHSSFAVVELRVAVLAGRRLLATTPAAERMLGPAPVYCKPPAPPTVDIPQGDGWVVGGDYIEGGPAPGIYECVSHQYTVTATDQGGNVAATETVAAGHSYTLVLPAGHYTLKASSCGFGSADVTAGRQTHADVVCPVP